MNGFLVAGEVYDAVSILEVLDQRVRAGIRGGHK